METFSTSAPGRCHVKKKSLLPFCSHSGYLPPSKIRARFLQQKSAATEPQFVNQEDQSATPSKKSTLHVSRWKLKEMARGNRQRRHEKTLVCVVQALMGAYLLVELRNETCLRGTLEECDNDMNLIMKDTTIESIDGHKLQLPLIFVRGCNIRFIHIPDSVNIQDAVEARRLMLDRAELAYMGGKGTPSATQEQASQLEMEREAIV